MNYMLYEKILENPNEHKSYHPKITSSVSLNIFFYSSVLLKISAGQAFQARDWKPGNLMLLEKRMAYIENDKRDKGF